MDVVSLCPLNVASLLWMPHAGLHVLTVVVKATYELAPGTSPLAERQEDPNEYDNHWNDEPTRSLYAQGDLVPFKPRADVVLVGHAFAPRQTPARSVVTRLCIAGIDKAIEVWTDRILMPDGSLREAAPFLKVPLRYERAAASADNPVGIRAEPRPDKGGAIPLPNLQPPGLRSIHPSGVIQTIGFGPIAPSWPIRASRLPRHMPELPPQWNQSPMPKSLDPGFFNAAPPDQQVERLLADERIVLENLHPQHPQLATSLAGIVPRAVVEREGAREELMLTADTLWIDTDRGICTVTWRGQHRLERPDSPGRVVVTMSQATTQAAHKDAANLVGTMLLSDEGDHDALVRAALKAVTGKVDISQTTEEGFGDITLQPTRSRGPTLPFVAAATSEGEKAAWFPPTQPVGDPHEDAGGTMLAPFGVAKAEPLPFPRGSTPAATQEPVVPAPPPPPPPPMVPPSPPSPSSPQRLESPPAVTVGQAAVLGGMVAATPIPTAMPSARPIKPLASSVASVDPSSESPGAAPKIGSVAALQNSGFVPGMPPPSAAAASNAAADPWFPTDSPAQPMPPARPRTPVELLWFDPTFVEAIRKDAAMRAILAERDQLQPGKKADKKQPPAKPAPGQPDPKDREDVNAILTLGSPSGVEALGATLAGALDEHGMFHPPLLLLGGELSFPFDEVETLKATIAAVTPLAAGDKKLKETIDAVGELLRTPWLQSAGSVTERLTNQVREAFAASIRSVPQGYLETHTERILLEQRHYQKRVVFGQPWIRALLGSPGTSTRVPTYVPHTLSRELPMYQHFTVRMIAEVRPQVDQYETHPNALRVVALGRVLGGVPRR